MKKVWQRDRRTDGNKCSWICLVAAKNNRVPLLWYFKLCKSFQSHWWIQTGVTVRKRSIRLKISDFFVSCDFEIWRMTLRNNRTPILCYFKIWASFHSHLWIQTVVTVRKIPIWVKIDDFFSPVTLKFDGWPWKNRTHLLCYFKLYASFHSYLWVTVQETPNLDRNRHI